MELEQDLGHARVAERVRRVGWAILCLLWFAALAGTFGSGPLSETAASGPELRVELERFIRSAAPQDLVVRLSPGVARSVRLGIDRGYLEGQQIESVLPEPESIVSGPDRLIFTFPGAPSSVIFHLRVQRTGFLKGWVGLEGHGRLEFRQIAYP